MSFMDLWCAINSLTYTGSDDNKMSLADFWSSLYQLMLLMLKESKRNKE